MKLTNQEKIKHFRTWKIGNVRKKDYCEKYNFNILSFNTWSSLSKNANPLNRRRTKTEKIQLIEEYIDSEYTIQDFCYINVISNDALRNYAMIYKKENNIPMNTSLKKLKDLYSKDDEKHSSINNDLKDTVSKDYSKQIKEDEHKYTSGIKKFFNYIKLKI